MANQGAKKRKEENRQHMTNLRRLIIACNVIYFVLRMIIFHSSFSWKHWVGLIVMSSTYWFSYQQLANMAKSTYSDQGDLMDGGFDMTTGGICSYLHDLIYITSFVQLSSIISDKFWLTYLAVAAFAAYKLFSFLNGVLPGFLKGVLSRGSSNDSDNEKSRKKREKMEKKAARGKMLRTRNR